MSWKVDGFRHRRGRATQGKSRPCEGRPPLPNAIRPPRTISDELNDHELSKVVLGSERTPRFGPTGARRDPSYAPMPGGGVGRRVPVRYE